jgi:dihydrofolate reductase
VVYSRTLRAASTARTRVEPSFDPGAVRRLKETAGHDLTVGGPDLAGQALRADLVDELQLFLVPIVVGGGKPWLPDNVQPDNVQINLELLGSHCFASGVVFLRYRPAGASGAAATER